MEQHEYVGEFRPDGTLAIHGEPREKFAVVEKVGVILEPIPRGDTRQRRLRRGGRGSRHESQGGGLLSERWR